MRIKSKKIKFNNGHGTKIIVPPGIGEFRLISVLAPVKMPYASMSIGVLQILDLNLELIKEIELKLDICQSDDTTLTYDLKENINLNQHKAFVFKHISIPPNYKGVITLKYQTSEITPIELKNPELEFEKHLMDYHNSKIVFSAPFGSGKSYFLDYFFDKRANKYEVFNVYPVNYSVASNEDIFKYIKTDILFQLLGKDVDFDLSKPEMSITLPQFLKDNILKIFAPFLIAVPKIGKDVYTIFQKLDELKDKLFEYHDAQKVDDSELVKFYISTIYEKEGSIFEDNYFTQIIRQLLERLKNNSQKENILVIEDLDRMDPEHLFRILNVISAHYDLNKASTDETHNKFGFDKIIVVCDVKNIKSIFHHKYGIGTDFNGYFNKYFSSKPYEFNNIESVNFFIQMILSSPLSKTSRPNPFINAHLFVLKSLIAGKQLKLRDVIMILRFDFNKTKLNTARDFDLVNYGDFTYSIAYFLSIFNQENFIQMLDNLLIQGKQFTANYYLFSLNLLTALGKNVESNKVEVLFKNDRYIIGYDNNHFSFDNFSLIEIISVNGNSSIDYLRSIDFQFEDFIELLKENLKVYSNLNKQKFG